MHKILFKNKLLSELNGMTHTLLNELGGESKIKILESNNSKRDIKYAIRYFDEGLKILKETKEVLHRMYLDELELHTSSSIISNALEEVFDWTDAYLDHQTHGRYEILMEVIFQAYISVKRMRTPKKVFVKL